MNKIVLCIDFNNVAFTCFYNKPLINNQGMNVNAIKGFFFKLKSYIDTFNPDYIILANDLSRNKTFRRKLFKPYKAQRKPADPDIINQMEYIQRLSSLLGLPILNNEEYEADDILGMISKLVKDNMDEYDTVIVSSDRDLYQLINERTYIMNPRNNNIIDLYTLYDDYKMSPEQWIELKMLQGDRSDNIPGIPGIGEVSALRLLNEYHNIENVYNHLNQLKPKTSELLIEYKDQLPLLKSLVTIITDYSVINLNTDMLKFNEPFPTEIYLLINELEIFTLLDLFKYELIPYVCRPMNNNLKGDE